MVQRLETASVRSVPIINSRSSLVVANDKDLPPGSGQLRRHPRRLEVAQIRLLVSEAATGVCSSHCREWSKALQRSPTVHLAALPPKDPGVRFVATKKDTEEGAGNEKMEGRREDCAFAAYTEVRSRAEITRSPFMR
ncbi:hypothetical protein V1477_011308 [Vespula maculifrons]|uniref:Uncharacterized protein n=1 Tax=Vespula maculifrons TaxID=7453 RepID=A0ABD2C572_VESMC